jgi:8-oxo-dGTP diphosphatase
LEKKRFCHFCGHPLVDKHCEGRWRLFCRRCEQPLYENPVPATCVIVNDARERILLVRRSVEPKIGQWCLPGGFLELGETPEQGAMRELEEETGIRGKEPVLLGVVAANNAQYGGVLMIGYRVAAFSGDAIAGDDASEVGFFPADEIPAIAFPSHRHFIRQVGNHVDSILSDS